MLCKQTSGLSRSTVAASEVDAQLLRTLATLCCVEDCVFQLYEVNSMKMIASLCKTLTDFNMSTCFAVARRRPWNSGTVDVVYCHSSQSLLPPWASMYCYAYANSACSVTVVIGLGSLPRRSPPICHLDFAELAMVPMS